MVLILYWPWMMFKLWRMHDRNISLRLSRLLWMLTSSQNTTSYMDLGLLSNICHISCIAMFFGCGFYLVTYDELITNKAFWSIMGNGKLTNIVCHMEGTPRGHAHQTNMLMLSHVTLLLFGYFCQWI